MSTASRSSANSYQPTFETSPPAVPAWKMELNAKLAAHRQRQPGSTASASSPVDAPGRAAERTGEGAARASRVAARVAERYAKAPSYSEFLAASAAAAAAAAETAAFAARQSQEASEAHARLTAAAAGEREQGGASDQTLPPPGCEPRYDEACQPTMAALSENRRATVEHPEPLPARGTVPPRPAGPPAGLFGNGAFVDALAEATVQAAVSLPAKLIEFPRELVAARKSRPRLAEGPLAEAPLFAEAGSPSLRIFEVEDMADAAHSAGEMKADPVAACQGAYQGSEQREHVYDQTLDGHPRGERPPGLSGRGLEGAPEWHSIRLGEHPAEESVGRAFDQPAAQTASPALPQVALLEDRLMAVLVDGIVVGGAFVLFIFVFALCTPHPPAGRTALLCGAGVLGAVCLFYQWLFMSYGGGTLGMRYARIALCTFEDGNPTRSIRRRRVAASMLSALPLGLGFLWALLDEDSLGWHDRMTRSYQRSYR